MKSSSASTIWLDTMSSFFMKPLQDCISFCSCFLAFSSLSAFWPSQQALTLSAFSSWCFSLSQASKSGKSSFLVLLTNFSTTLSLLTLCTSLRWASSWKPTWPMSMPGVFLRLRKGVQTILTVSFLQPSMLFSLTNWQHSSKALAGTSSNLSPGFRRRYTWAEERLSTWNHRSSGQPHLSSSSFSNLSLPMQIMCLSEERKQNTICIIDYMHRLGRKYIQHNNYFQVGTKHWQVSSLVFLEMLLGPTGVFLLSQEVMDTPEKVLFLIYSAGLPLLFLSLVLSDPGVYPPLMGTSSRRKAADFEAEPASPNTTHRSQQEGVQAKVCKYCNHPRPLRSHHCASCNLCVEMFDHHCPILNNCIGRRNHKRFLFFVFYTLIFLVASVANLSSILELSMKNGYGGYWVLGVIIGLSIQTFQVVVLFCQQVVFVCRGIKTVEYIKRDKHKHSGKTLPEYSQGLLRNIIGFLLMPSSAKTLDKEYFQLKQKMQEDSLRATSDQFK